MTGSGKLRDIALLIPLFPEKLPDLAGGIRVVEYQKAVEEERGR